MKERGESDECDCPLSLMNQRILNKFGPDLMADAGLVAELHQERDGQLDPSWDWLIYEGVKVYKTELSKFERDKMRPQNG